MGINRDREILRDVTDTERRLSNTVFLAQVAKLDAKNARMRIQAGSIYSDWIPYMTLRAGPDRTWHIPEPGEQVLVAAPNGDINQAVVLGAVYQETFPPPADDENLSLTHYKDGTVLEYDREQHRWLLDMRANDGTMEIYTGTTQVIIGPHNVWLRADRIDLNDDR